MLKRLWSSFNNLSFAVKLTAAFMVAALIPLVTVSVFAYLRTTSILTEDAIQQEQQLDRERAVLIGEYLSEADRELLTMRDLTSVQRLAAALAAGDAAAADAARADVAQDFASFAQDIQIYDQITYLDVNGNEIVRVSWDGSSVTILADQALVNQGDQPYFTQAINSEIGTVIGSPVEATQEQAPVIRFATPVDARQTGATAGVVVSTVLFQPVIDLLTPVENETIYLVDSRGRFIEHPNPERELSSGTSYTLADEFPAASERISAADADNFQSDGILFVYEPVTLDYAGAGSLTVLSTEQVSAVLARARSFQVVLFGALIVTVLLVIGLSTGLSRLLTRQVDEIDGLLDKLRIGEFDQRAEVLSQDELGRSAAGVNAMLDYLQDLLARSEEAAEYRLAILDNLDAFVGIGRLEDSRALYVNPAGMALVGRANQAYTDLTIADFHPGDVMPYIQDEALPAMIEKGYWSGESVLEHVSGRRIPVDMTYILLKDSAGNPYAVGTLMRNIEAERQLQEDLSQMVSLMTNQAATSSETAEQASVRADEGNRAVNQTIEAMERIRENTQETARRIKRLGEVTQEITESVHLIEELADRTTVLALNASIQAAAAGEAGRGFAVVAEEVQRLAERAAGASRQIENLVKNIQSETNEAVYGVEQATREVVDGSQLAEEAGAKMNELNRLVTELAGLIQHVADTTAEQTNESLAALIAAPEMPARGSNGNRSPAVTGSTLN